MSGHIVDATTRIMIQQLARSRFKAECMQSMLSIMTAKSFSIIIRGITIDPTTTATHLRLIPSESSNLYQTWTPTSLSTSTSTPQTI
eukprot:1466363-Rhodomonas_salina.2